MPEENQSIRAASTGNLTRSTQTGPDCSGSPQAGQGSDPLTATTAVAAPNPLLEARVDSIEELFSRDPEGYTKGADGSPASGPDMQAIVAGLRRQRDIWEKAEATGATRAPAPKKASSKAAIADLSALGLDS